jgi:HPt (histidine-containing phosphotransfer) domain-containing protein
MPINDLPPLVRDALSRRFLGNLSFYKQMACLFIQNSQEQMEKLCTAVTVSDWETVHFIAHNLKGGASNVGAEDVTSLAAALERLSHDSLRSDILQLVADLQRALHNFEQLLSNMQYSQSEDHLIGSTL